MTTTAILLRAEALARATTLRLLVLPASTLLPETDPYELACLRGVRERAKGPAPAPIFAAVRARRAEAVARTLRRSPVVEAV